MIQFLKSLLLVIVLLTLFTACETRSDREFKRNLVLMDHMMDETNFTASDWYYLTNSGFLPLN